MGVKEGDIKFFIPNIYVDLSALLYNARRDLYAFLIASSYLGYSSFTPQYCAHLGCPHFPFIFSNNEIHSKMWRHIITDYHN